MAAGKRNLGGLVLSCATCWMAMVVRELKNLADNLETG